PGGRALARDHGRGASRTHSLPYHAEAAGNAGGSRERGALPHPRRQLHDRPDADGRRRQDALFLTRTYSTPSRPFPSKEKGSPNQNSGRSPSTYQRLASGSYHQVWRNGVLRTVPSLSLKYSRTT